MNIMPLPSRDCGLYCTPVLVLVLVLVSACRCGANLEDQILEPDFLRRLREFHSRVEDAGRTAGRCTEDPGRQLTP